MNEDPIPDRKTPDGIVELHSFSPDRRNHHCGLPGAAVSREERLESSVEAAVGRAEDGGVVNEIGAGPPDNLWVAKHVGLPLCEGMLAYRMVSEGTFSCAG